MSASVHRALPLVLAVLVVLASASSARADDDPGEDVRIERACTGASTVRLRVRAGDDDRLRVEIDVRTPRRGARWVVVLIHERRLVFRAVARTPSSGTLSLRRTIADWPGRDSVIVRALGPRGEICRAAVAVDEPVSD